MQYQVRNTIPVNNSSTSSIQDILGYVDSVDLLSMLSTKCSAYSANIARLNFVEYKAGCAILRRAELPRLEELTDSLEANKRKIEAIKNFKQLTGRSVMDCIQTIADIDLKRQQKLELARIEKLEVNKANACLIPDSVYLLERLSGATRMECIRLLQTRYNYYSACLKLMKSLNAACSRTIFESETGLERAKKAIKLIEKRSGRTFSNALLKLIENDPSKEVNPVKPAARSRNFNLGSKHREIPPYFHLNGRGALLAIVQIENRVESGEKLEDVLARRQMPREIFDTLAAYKKYLLAAVGHNRLALNPDGTIHHSIKQAAILDSQI